MRTLVARAPTRIDFGGGWTDVPPYPAERGGFVCNVAIDRYATVTIREGSPLHPSESPLVRAALARAGVSGVTVMLSCDFPVGAGLGGSSAASVALAGAIAAWKGEHLSATELVERSRATEVADLGIAGGWKYHFAAVHGGVQALTFAAESTTAVAIPVSHSVARDLARRCLLFYTGESRISARAIQLVIDAYTSGDQRVMASLAAMKENAQRMAAALRNGAGDAIDRVGTLLREHWEKQMMLHREITTDRIDAIQRTAYGAGALGLKALGASGGGCVVVVARAGTEDSMRELLEPLGEPLSYSVDTMGFTVIEDSGADA
jgi:D-glycero-alpha-D-manno-heptose-7-phosphate kinase